ncbi:tRNA (adenine(58)-N(1))-methyltransferase non-catalytic subunit TRM6-like protein [Dinothrombium tinctorium]|uniref:tRNA (adenine(58)-N(1))-methyltransferase non-catalytic subunit TRM6 n=1 Tax=Dinothrombium tinctorium TaxID=1965070 RepID=A0A3S3NX07_9ACAR|nr:tRNA (adenine(58)-N(1))-methyltransferase non-catalytic subunit TRM6-like protein [Dinothrombium tinctorium]RWS10515.1 tRNA (adenine(58)-N(1))-methyltransferase non-catalytic subunit TRM6-like protein [Dinothrombium tinctorium]RWS10753.1 tRNA (adenine(58)-N(1))-methyltransferase non-catalytic subunit TRM6-like protein [Dinothrombium tinctorium]RWS10794.1 tRNA (adenine(58)-N(1))-methyltransferase non-catalytic subunit TRM6-like protein [Dinothrombium tinctorium]
MSSESNGGRQSVPNANGVTEKPIESGDHVVFRKINDASVCRLLKVERNADIYLGRQRYNVNSVIGAHFGSIFELDAKTKCMKRSDLNEEQLKQLLKSQLPADEEDEDKEETKDNRFIVDDGQSQKLSKEVIETLKDEGVTGEKIIETLIENSSSFKMKTSFSQEKYLKKKHQKYLNFIRVYKPNPALLTEMYYAQNPRKINNLRIDTISQMLCLCNVRSGSKYMVVDTCMGLVTASIVDRLVGDGSVVASGYDPGVCIQIFLEQGPASTWRQAVEALNLSPEILDSCLCSIQINKVNEIQKQGETEKEQIMNFESEELDNETDSVKRRKLDEKIERKIKRLREEEKAKQILKEKKMDALLIITRNYDPENILNLLIEFLAPSRPLAIFSYFAEPLVKCYHSLKEKAINVKITETWLRRYQVLPSRTRPDMNMSSNGGYLLTAIKIDSHN